jgi:hypothetical protein
MKFKTNFYSRFEFLTAVKSKLSLLSWSEEPAGYLNPKLEASGSSEMSIPVYHTTRCYTQKTVISLLDGKGKAAPVTGRGGP